MRMIWGLLFLSSFVLAKEEFKKDAVEQCQVAREFVTTLEYLRAKSVYAVPEDQARKVADKVSSGCTGAARRFVATTELLVTAGLDTKSAIEAGIKFAKLSESHAINFQHIFRQAFTAKYLDLPLNTSLEVAMKLSGEFDGNHKKAREDFDKLVSFCMDKKKLDLPIPYCAQAAARITQNGDRFSEPIAKSFLKLYEFLTSKDGPSRTVVDALKIAEDIIKNGPVGADNFIFAYKFATSKKGLDLDGTKSITFALNIANRTVRE